MISNTQKLQVFQDMEMTVSGVDDI